MDISLATVAWSMNAGFGIMVFVVFATVMLQQGVSIQLLTVALMAISATGMAFVELIIQRTTNSETAMTMTWFANYFIGIMIIGIVVTVRQHQRNSLKVLGNGIISAWLICMIANTVLPGNLTFSTIDDFQTSTSYWGEPFSIPVGVPGPLRIVADLISVLLLVFLFHAAVKARKDMAKENFRLIIMMIIFIVTAGIHTPLVDLGYVKTPYLISFAFMGIVFVFVIDIATQYREGLASQFRQVEWQRRWNALLETLPLAIKMSDLQGNVVFENSENIRITALIEPDNLNVVGLANNGDYFGVVEGDKEKIFIGNDGKLVHMLWDTFIERDSIGNKTGVLAVGRDITQRREAQRQANVLDIEMRRVSRVNELGEIGASLAHELNQPLSAILSDTQAVRIQLDGKIGPEIQEIFADIITQNRRASEIVRSYTMLLRQDDHPKAEFDLIDALEDVITVSNSQARLNDVELETNFCSRAVKIFGRKIDVQQLALNLILNAIRAASENKGGSVKIEVAVENECTLISVRDNGPGISKKVREKLFQPFFTTRKQGMGMGLTIAARIAKEHDGQLELSNDSETGSCFIVTMPLYDSCRSPNVVTFLD